MAHTIVEEIAENRIESAAAPARPSLLAPLRVRDFRLLWVGESISLLGDQFQFVALPWLVLQLTGSGLAVGSILAVAGIPRAIFMLIGGAITDRLSPRTLMLLSNALRAVLVIGLTLMVLTNTVQLWMLYVIALIFGLVDAFFLPAQAAMVPRLVAPEHLEPANAITQITAQLSQFLGPALAGVVISAFANSANQAVEAAARGGEGIAIAFGFDALTFIVATIMIWLMKTSGKLNGNGHAEKPQSLGASIGEGLRAVWNDSTVRILVLVTAGINFLLTGPTSVGIPVMANARFTEGAAAFGVIVSAFGGGALVGAILAGSLPRPRHFGVIVLGLIAVTGLGLALLGFVYTLPMAALISAAMGVGAGYGNVMMIAWLQKRIQPEMMGRMMGILMLSSVGLQPISQAVAGLIVDINLSLLFAGAGVLLVIISLAATASPAVRDMR